MIDLILPRTDGGVLAQLAVVTVVFATAAWLTRRRKDVRVLVIGLWLVAYGGMGVRALH